MKKNLFWQIGAAAAVIGGIFGTYGFGAYDRKAKGKKNDEILPKYRRLVEENLLTPADWVFYTLWPTIYAGTISLSVHQALPSHETNPRYEKARPWLAVCYGLNALFGYFFSKQDRQSILTSNVVTILTLPPALALHQSLEIGKTPVSLPERIFRIPISLYAGWLSVASVVAGSGGLITAGLWQTKRKDDVLIDSAILPVTAGIGYAVARRLNDPIYLVPFAWGFAGIAAKQYGRNDLLAGLAGGLALANLAVVITNAPRGSFEPIEKDIYDVEAEVISAPYETTVPHQANIARERTVEID